MHHTARHCFRGDKVKSTASLNIGKMKRLLTVIVVALLLGNSPAVAQEDSVYDRVMGAVVDAVLDFTGDPDDVQALGGL